MYEVKYRELQDTVIQLAKVPDDEFIKPMYETLDGLNIELGGLTEKQAALDAQLAELTNSRSELQRKIEQINSKIATSYELDEKLQSVLKVEKVLARYHLHLAKQKIYSLQEEFMLLRVQVYIPHIFSLLFILATTSLNFPSVSSSLANLLLASLIAVSRTLKPAPISPSFKPLCL